MGAAVESWKSLLGLEHRTRKAQLKSFDLIRLTSWSLYKFPSIMWHAILWEEEFGQPVASGIKLKSWETVEEHEIQGPNYMDKETETREEGTCREIT